MAAYLLTIFSRLPSRPEGRAQWQYPLPSALAFPSTLSPAFPPPGIEPRVYYRLGCIHKSGLLSVA